MSAAGAAQASMGFSGLAMTFSMLSNSVFLVWVILVGIHMWTSVVRPIDSKAE
jgi:hypothetical protein